MLAMTDGKLSKDAAWAVAAQIQECEKQLETQVQRLAELKALPPPPPELLVGMRAARADRGWSVRPARRRGGSRKKEGPAQAAHAAEGEEEVVALSKFVCARHACGAAGRRPPCSARSAQLPKPYFEGQNSSSRIVRGNHELRLHPNHRPS